MAEEYGETQVWPVRPPYLVDTETRCGDSGHSVGGSPCRLTIVGGGRRRAGGWAPQALEEIVRLRRLCGSAGRPLNFTVRGTGSGNPDAFTSLDLEDPSLPRRA